MRYNMEKRLHRVMISFKNKDINCPKSHTCDKASQCDRCNSFFKKCSYYKK